ncbi:MAG: hypothetical protein Q8N18_25095 [Opitutaceae bacterium]|nr:hypothetical protein [Opitutaceae bacterium]
MTSLEKTLPISGPEKSPAADGPRFSKARPLAARIGVCAKTLFRYADQGLIARHKINARTVLFDVREVEAFITRCRAA